METAAQYRLVGNDIMAVITETILIQSKGNVDIIDVTDQIGKILRETDLKDGLVTIFTPGSTCAVTTIEYEPGLIEDLAVALERIAPQNIEYKHNLKWSDGNGHSHVRASLLGPSMTIPFSNSTLLLGRWQQIVCIDLDNRPRSRRLIIQIIGE